MLYLLLVIAVLGFAVIGYFDYNSTMSGIKRGTTHEANKAVAWLLRKYPRLAPYVLVLMKLPAGAALVLGVYQVTGSLALATIALYLIEAAYYYFIIRRNYRIAK